METMNYVNRAGWNAAAPRRVDTLPWDKIDTIFVHYTSMESDQTGDPRERMRGVQRFHQITKGWNDIAYNWAFTFAGLILQGRGWGVKSAATGSENSHSVAFVFLGGDKVGRDDVTPKGRSALGKLIRVAMDLKRGNLTVKGHTQAPDPTGQTACPGDELLSYISQKGWVVPEPKITWPKNFFLFAEWYLGEGRFKQYGPHNLKFRPKQLPGRFTPKTQVLMAYLRIYLKRRKGIV